MVNEGIRSNIDISPEMINYKIRCFSSNEVPIKAVIGKQEMANNTVTIRQLGSDQQEIISLQNLVNIVKDQNTHNLT